MNIILVGYRGTGKSTVAQLLASRLQWNWVDSDQLIQQAAGRTIAEIFAIEGEEAFRDRESEILAAQLGSDRRVLALGGGAVLKPENRRLLATAGRVVWLKATPETIHRRLSADPRSVSQRPDLTPVGGLQEIRALLLQREPVYRECAELEVDTEDKDPAAVVDEILAQLKIAIYDASKSAGKPAR